MAATRWYVRDAEGVESGPFSPADLRTLVGSGRVRRGTLVRNEAMSEFVVARAGPRALPGAGAPARRPPCGSRTSPARSAEPAHGIRIGPTRPYGPAWRNLATGEAWDNLPEILAARPPERESGRRGCYREPGRLQGDYTRGACRPPPADPGDDSGEGDEVSLLGLKSALLAVLTDPRGTFRRAHGPWHAGLLGRDDRGGRRPLCPHLGAVPLLGTAGRVGDAGLSTNPPFRAAGPDGVESELGGMAVRGPGNTRAGPMGGMDFRLRDVPHAPALPTVRCGRGPARVP